MSDDAGIPFPWSEVGDDFSGVLWHYHLDFQVDGSDRQNLPLALEGEAIAFERHVGGREQLDEMIRRGRLTFRKSLEEPLAGFDEDVRLLATFLFSVVRALEVREEVPAGTDVSKVRATKILACRGDVARVPLVVGVEEGRLVVDPDRDDVEAIAAHWAEYPRWLQDGMRKKHARLGRM
jgi:hypothetical protein